MAWLHHSYQHMVPSHSMLLKEYRSVFLQHHARGTANMEKERNLFCCVRFTHTICREGHRSTLSLCMRWVNHCNLGKNDKPQRMCPLTNLTCPGSWVHKFRTQCSKENGIFIQKHYHCLIVHWTPRTDQKLLALHMLCGKVAVQIIFLINMHSSHLNVRALMCLKLSSHFDAQQH